VVSLSVDGGDLTDNGDGTWTFEPAADFNGDINLSYGVSDGVSATSASGTVEVSAINDAAEVSTPTAFSMNEDGTLTIAESDLLANATDVDGDNLSVVNLSANGGNLTNNSDGTWTFEPAADFNGDIDLSYGVSDGTTTTATTGTIDVASINDAAAVSGPTSFSANEDRSVTISEIDLLANSTDIEGDSQCI